MRLTKLKMLALAALGVFLSACGGDSALDKKTAKELFQQASSQLYANDAQYNFSSTAKIYTTVENPFTDELKILISGAVDNKSGRYEVNPEIQAGVINVKFPLLVDINKKEIIVNPGNIVDTVGMFVPEAGRQLAAYKGKHVRFSLSNFDIDTADLEMAMQAFSEFVRIGVGAMGEFNKNIPEQSIKKLELDSKAKEINAKAKIRVDLDHAQSKELQRQVNAYFIAEVSKSDSLPQELKQNFVEAMMEVDSVDNGIENSSSIMYLNDKGQLIHGQDTYNFVVEHESASITMSTDYSNYAKPVFKVAPKSGDIIDFTQQDLEQMKGY